MHISGSDEYDKLDHAIQDQFQQIVHQQQQQGAEEPQSPLVNEELSAELSALNVQQEAPASPSESIYPELAMVVVGDDEVGEVP